MQLGWVVTCAGIISMRASVKECEIKCELAGCVCVSDDGECGLC